MQYKCQHCYQIKQTDDIDDLLATLTLNNNQPKSQPIKSTFDYGQSSNNNNNNKKPSFDLDDEDDILGGYNPSGTTFNKGYDQKPYSSTGFGASKPTTTTQGQYNVDDVLKIFDDNDDDKIFGKATSKTNNNNNSNTFGIKAQANNNISQKSANTFFDEFDLDLDDNNKNNTTYGKSTGYIPSSSLADNKKGATDSAFKKNDNDYLEKRASVFGIPSNPKVNNMNNNTKGNENFSISSSRDIFKEKDSSPLVDTFDDFKKRDNHRAQTAQPMFPSSNKFGNERSKSILDEDNDDNDEFPTIDIQHSRRGRNSTRKVSQNIQQKDDRSNSPLGAPSSAKRSIFDDNPSKTANQLDDEQDYSGYNPTLSRLPSRNRSGNRDKPVENTQKPPRLLKTHDEFEAPTKPGINSTNNVFSEKNMYDDNKNNNLFSDNFGDGGRNGNRFGNNNNDASSFRDRKDYNDGFGNNNKNYDNNLNTGNNRMVSAQIQLKTDKSSVLDSLERPGDSHFMSKPNNTFGLSNQSDFNQTQQKMFSEAPAKQITYNNTTRPGAAGGIFINQQPQIVKVQESFNQEESLRNTEVFNKETVSQDFFKNTKVFEDTKKQIQEETMHQMTMIRNNYEGQIQLMRQNHEEQLQHERKIRENIVEEMQNLLKTEKDRLKIWHESEMKSKEQTWEYEKQQLQRTFQSETEMQKRQIEQQQKMLALADEIRVNADKLNSLTDKYQNNNSTKKSIEDDDMKDREMKLLSQENKLKIEQDYIENERIRLNKMREDLDSRESLLRQQIEAEKGLLKREYHRLQELQDQISSQDQDKKRQLIIERQELINQKTQTQDERLKIKEEYQESYKELEMQVIVFEKQKQAQDVQIIKLEAMYKTKIQENDEIRQKLMDQEQNLMKRQKIIELKELEIGRKEMDCKKISNVSFQERNELETEQKKVYDLQRKLQSEQQSILDFKQSFQQEKDKLDRYQNDLMMKEKKIQQDLRHVETEKRDLQMMQRTLQSLKSDAIKEFDPKKLSVLNTSLISQMHEDNSFLTRKENVNTSNINYNQTSSNYHPRSSSMNAFKKDHSFQEVLSNNFIQSAHPQRQTDQQAFKKPPLSLNQTQNRGLIQNEQPNNPYKIVLNQQNQQGQQYNAHQFKAFNLNEFMTQLKVIDQSSNFNQAYISKERENLFIKDQFGSEYVNSHNQNARSSSYTQSHFYDSSPYLNKPSNSSVESHQ